MPTNHLFTGAHTLTTPLALSMTKKAIRGPLVKVDTGEQSRSFGPRWQVLPSIQGANIQNIPIIADYYTGKKAHCLT